MLELAIKNENLVSGNLYMNDARFGVMHGAKPKVISITKYFMPERRKVEKFIEQSFREAYRADIKQHYPTLMSVWSADGDILAAVGFRVARDQALFLEQYLESDVEDELASQFQKPVTRSEIVEIGGLASAGGGASVFLFIALVAYLKEQGYSFATVTATRKLQAAFKFMGLKSVDLGEARRSCLCEGQDDWGSYYETKPRVLAGALATTYEKLEHFLPLSENKNLHQVFARLHPYLEGAAK